ncbi:2,6-dihydroxypyridine 3-monooxygenase [Frankliniella fusca]|uniref:2,6-dihydroxypyridine 3-monooxygenase n=1 Tax=Frankliniella fusca TaxID=407009 RepID=A0AAE1HMT1_9NEOP|nr:2,6-dihydroxypyridine 3-monooxygenase [Frankliniella fusca]
MGPKKVQTRASSSCSLFGASSDFTGNQLPTYKDVMKCVADVRATLMAERGNNYTPSIFEVASVVARRVKVIWDKATIPTLSEDYIIKLIQRYNDKCIAIKKSISKTSAPVVQNRNKFLSEARCRLFDVAACKCPSFENCKCERLLKVPVQEQSFILDQRTDRKMVIGGVDVKTTAVLQKREARRERDTKKRSGSPQAGPSKQLAVDPELDTEFDNSPHTHDIDLTEKADTEYPAPRQRSARSAGKYNTVKLPNVATVVDRCGLSDREAALVVSATIQDMGMMGDDGKEVVDKSKVRRSREKARESLQTEQLVNRAPVSSIYFDGKKKSNLHVLEHGPTSMASEKQELVVLLEEPGSHFIGHVVPSEGNALVISEAILNFYIEHDISLDKVKAVGCDGTGTNTGWKGGVVKLIEERLGHPLHWFICQLHANELPLRHLIEHLDGPTSGPNSFNGEIGKLLKTCETRAVVQFEPIPVDLPFVDTTTLSKDQSYLKDICLAVSSGVCTEQLAKRYPGNLSHARWLTTASRILRLYISSNDPNLALILLAGFVMKVYATAWFQIKREPFSFKGPEHVLRMVQNSRYLPERIKKVIDPVIERNAFFAHPENILLAMLVDHDDNVRQLGVEKVLQARLDAENSTSDAPKSIRPFHVPKLNFEAECYWRLIDWETTTVTPPPFVVEMKVDELRQLCEPDGHLALRSTLKGYPCHTQAVERAIKAISTAGDHVAGEDRRDGYVRCTLQSRSKIQNFNSKKDYKK